MKPWKNLIIQRRLDPRDVKAAPDEATLRHNFFTLLPYPSGPNGVNSEIKGADIDLLYDGYFLDIFHVGNGRTIEANTYYVNGIR